MMTGFPEGNLLARTPDALAAAGEGKNYVATLNKVFKNAQSGVDDAIRQEYRDAVGRKKSLKETKNLKRPREQEDTEFNKLCRQVFNIVNEETKPLDPTTTDYRLDKIGPATVVEFLDKKSREPMKLYGGPFHFYESEMLSLQEKVHLEDLGRYPEYKYNRRLEAYTSSHQSISDSIEYGSGSAKTGYDQMRAPSYLSGGSSLGDLKEELRGLEFPYDSDAGTMLQQPGMMGPPPQSLREQNLGPRRPKSPVNWREGEFRYGVLPADREATLHGSERMDVETERENLPEMQPYDSSVPGKSWLDYFHEPGTPQQPSPGLGGHSGGLSPSSRQLHDALNAGKDLRSPSPSRGAQGKTSPAAQNPGRT